MSTTTAGALPVSVRAAEIHAPQRITSIDQLRGLVMLLMALDHVRDYFSIAHFDPLDPTQTTIGLYVTRWITHLCAPTFMLLAGVSAHLAGQRCTTAQLSRFLFTRGLWLIVLEPTLIWFAWSFSLDYSFGIGLQVIWALGASMIFLAVLVYLPRGVTAAIALGMICGHNLLDNVAPYVFGAWAPLWRLLHVEGPNGIVFVIYPLVPWLGVMALGYLLGAVYEWPAQERQRLLSRLGTVMIVAFILLRWSNVYGDPRPWTATGDAVISIMSFFDVEKYPPSLLYLLVTLGIALMLLARFERKPLPSTSFFLAFGRVPMFFYVLHIIAAHLAAGLIALAMGFGLAVLTEPFMLMPKAWGFSLPVVYLAWLAVLALTYPACRWYADVKRRRRDWWLSYI